MTAKKGTIILSIVAIIVIGGLFFGNLTTKKKENPGIHAHQNMDTDQSFDDFEESQIALLEVSEQQQAKKLKENFLAAKNDSEKVLAAHEAAHFWEAKTPELELFYHFHAAELEKNLEDLVKVGDDLFMQFRQSKNVGIKNNLITFALRSYESALKLSPNDNTLKLKAGTVYVEGSTEPMKGISLLREVIAAEPDNVSALILLGRFSIMSGQYDKAKERLDQALLINPSNAEAIFFMAITQQGLGNNDKAIELFETCKKLVNNPDFDAEINGYIEDLKSNKK